MIFPGNNTLTLTNEAIMQAVEREINCSTINAPKIRVTAIKFSPYGAGAEFTITTDPVTTNDNQEQA